jgi:predicted DNA-binding protein with PD1-like motif
VKKEWILGGLVLGCLCILSPGLKAQPTRTEVVKSTSPEEDARPNSDSVPADITNMNGYIIDGRVHVHITLASEEGAFGGHLEEGTHVFTFAIVTIGVFKEGIDLSRVDDKTYR